MVFLKLQIETLVVENLGHLLGPLPGQIHLLVENQRRDFAAKTGGHGDQPLVVLAQQIPVDPGLVVEALAVGDRYQVAEVAVAGQVHAQQHQVSRGLGGNPGVAFFKARAGGHVDLAADDRLDPRGHGLGVELDGAEHVAVIGYGNRRHFTVLGPLDQVGDLDGAVKQAVLAVQMQVYEIGVFHKFIQA